MAIAARWLSMIAIPRPEVVALPRIGYNGAAKAAVSEFITPSTDAAVPASEP